MMRHASLVLLVLLVACGKNETSGGPAPAASVTNAAASIASAPRAAAVDAAPADSSFEGTYTAEVGTLTLPADAPSWHGDDAGTGLGPGTLSFTIDAATGRISGKGDGALGPVIVNGLLGEAGVVSFTLARADAKDGGFTGVGRGTLAGSKIEGNLRASSAIGNVLREGTFALSKK